MIKSTHFPRTRRTLLPGYVIALCLFHEMLLRHQALSGALNGGPGFCHHLRRHQALGSDSGRRKGRGACCSTEAWIRCSWAADGITDQVPTASAPPGETGDLPSLSLGLPARSSGVGILASDFSTPECCLPVLCSQHAWQQLRESKRKH